MTLDREDEVTSSVGERIVDVEPVPGMLSVSVSPLSVFSSVTSRAPVIDTRSTLPSASKNVVTISLLTGNVATISKSQKSPAGRMSSFGSSIGSRAGAIAPAEVADVP